MLDVILVLALNEAAFVDEDKYIIAKDEVAAEEWLILVYKVWIPLDIGELVSLKTILTLVVDGAILPDIAIFDEE